MALQRGDDGAHSVFSYGSEGEPDTFSLVELSLEVCRHYGFPCTLRKLAEGGNHKIYDVLHAEDSNRSLNALVRVASPSFPRDKMESEVATMKYLSLHTTIPVPAVYAWSSDASGPVGAEYMIIEKMEGRSASEIWETLSLEKKRVAVSQVAKHLFDLFSLRFDTAGSLYLSQHGFYVGPIVSVPFFRTLDGAVRVPESTYYSIDLKPFRGPYSTTTEWLSSFPNAELHFLSIRRDVALKEFSEEDVRDGKRVLGKVLELCKLYPGDDQVHHITTPDKPLSITLDDFRLSNVMLDEDSGRVTGLIDFECATIAPLWACAGLPHWLCDPESSQGSFEGGPPEERRELASAFRAVINESDPSGEWSNAAKSGIDFREFVDRLQYQFTVWIELEEWIDTRLAWARDHPGVGMEEQPFGI